MSLITALTSMPEFREMRISREGDDLVAEVRLTHPDETSLQIIGCSLVSALPGEDPERMIMAAFGACCVRRDQELYRGEHAPSGQEPG